MKRLRFFRVAAPAAALVLGIWTGPLGCRKHSPTDLCLAEDLGRFSLVAVAAGPAPDGCQATYRDRAGATVRVWVAPLRPGAMDDAGTPASFERHMVFSRARGPDLDLAWYSDAAAVRLRLPGAAEPGGPVLRAYLFRYPSKVVDEVEATKRDVEMLRQSSRQTPGDAAVHLDLARKYRKLGNTVMAAQEYHIAVEKNRHCYPCYLEMGTLYRQLRHWDLSIRALRKAAKLDPAATAPWLTLGDVGYHVRNRIEAIRGYSRALELGLSGEDAQRAQERLAELRDGKFMIQVLPGFGRDGGAGPEKSAKAP